MDGRIPLSQPQATYSALWWAGPSVAPAAHFLPHLPEGHAGKQPGQGPCQHMMEPTGVTKGHPAFCVHRQSLSSTFWSCWPFNISRLSNTPVFHPCYLSGLYNPLWCDVCNTNGIHFCNINSKHYSNSAIAVATLVLHPT